MTDLGYAGIPGQIYMVQISWYFVVFACYLIHICRYIVKSGGGGRGV